MGVGLVLAVLEKDCDAREVRMNSVGNDLWKMVHALVLRGLAPVGHVSSCNCQVRVSRLLAPSADGGDLHV